MKVFKIVLLLILTSYFVISCQKDPFTENIRPVVSAGSDTTITLTSITGDSTQLHGTATDQDGTVEAYLWSQISGPTTATIVTPGSASSTVKGLVSGKYVFQLMAIDNKGATGVKSVGIAIIKQLNINLNSGLLAYFPFNNNFNDLSGNGNNGTVSIYGGNLTADNKGVANSAFNVNGNGQELIVNNNGKIIFDSSFTVSFNCMTRDFGRFTFFGMLDYPTGYGQTFSTATGDPTSKNFGFGVTNQNASCSYWAQPNEVSGVNSDFIPLPGQWNNYICIFNRGVKKIFLNGILIQIETTKDKVAKLCASSELTIGGWSKVDPGASLNGKIDEVRLYNRELTSDEISDLSKEFR